MKKIIVFLFILGYYTGYGQVYKVELEGKFLPAKIIFGDGVVRDILMKYQQPEFFKNPSNKFTISMGAESEAYSHTGGIEAFLIDNTVWALRTVEGKNQFVSLRMQGAIEQFEVVINGKFGEVKEEHQDEKYIILGSRTKLITRNNLKNENIAGNPSDEKIVEWISDSPETMEDFRLAQKDATAETKRLDSLSAAGVTQGKSERKGLLGALENAKIKETQLKQEASTNIDMWRLVNNYNAYYEAKNPGKIKYYFVSKPIWKALPAKVKTDAEIKAEKQAKLDNQWAGRTPAGSPELASAKDNTPVKKETFDAKLKRIAADGNKVGVLLILTPVRKLASGQQLGSEVVNDENSYMDESLYEAGIQIVKELNEAFGTTVIELVDLSKMPYRDTKVMGHAVRLDDWWASKFKVVFEYTIDPLLRYEVMSIKGEYKNTTALNLRTSMVVKEYIGNTTATKQDFLAQILNMGGFITPVKAHDDGEEATSVEELYKSTLEKLEVPLLEKIKNERASGISKVVNKFKK
ncbi:MAG: hypothetical protein PHD06_02150 [Bacteroidales bacterium]|nr:hypothetical protein [Bacteroidales bacterium]MDD4383961.1 hypothetical protein [Bacteroidales bacterium]MDY0196366.1 hypothetical protein [Tenuifilaceae bacterium]